MLGQVQGFLPRISWSSLTYVISDSRDDQNIFTQEKQLQGMALSRHISLSALESRGKGIISICMGFVHMVELTD